MSERIAVSFSNGRKRLLDTEVRTVPRIGESVFLGLVEYVVTDVFHFPEEGDDQIEVSLEAV